MNSRPVNHPNIPIKAPITVTPAQINDVPNKAQNSDNIKRGYLVSITKSATAMDLSISAAEVLTEAGLSTALKINELAIVQCYEVSSGTRTGIFPIHTLTYNTTGSLDFVQADLTVANSGAACETVMAFRTI